MLSMQLPIKDQNELLFFINILLISIYFLLLYFSKVSLFVPSKYNADNGITINAMNSKKMLRITERESPNGANRGFYNPR